MNENMKKISDMKVDYSPPITMTNEEFSKYFTVKPTLTKTYNQSFWMIQTAIWSFVAGMCFCLLMILMVK